MSLVFAQRLDALERMDVEPLDKSSTARILNALEKVNAWLGGVRATLNHLQRFSRRWNPEETIRIIDWGTGGADIPRAIVRWARSRRFQVEIVGVDNNPSIVEYARQACREYPEIRIVQGDFLSCHPDETKKPFDYAISSLCLHHLKDQEIVSLLKQSDRMTRRGIIMNDLKRSARAWAWIWALTRLTRAHPIVQNDGPLSVRRAFTSQELEYLAAQSGLSCVKVSTHFGYRLVLAGEKI